MRADDPELEPPPFGVAVREEDGQLLVVPSGELDIHAVEELRARLDEAAADGRPLVLDLRELDFIDSSGLKLAIVWARRMRERGLPFSIVRGGEDVQRPFRSAGVEGMLPFVDAPEPAG